MIDTKHIRKDKLAAMKYVYEGCGLFFIDSQGQFFL